jgi:predicted PurR-regulated permease PerM
MLRLLEDPQSRPERSRPQALKSAGVPAALTIVTIICLLGAAATLVPFWPSLVVASWVAALVAPSLERLAPNSVERQRYVALFVTCIVIASLGLLAIVTVSLVEAGAELVRTLLATESGAAALRALVSNGGVHELDFAHLRPEELADVMRRYGATALTALGLVFGETTRAVASAVVFVTATYFLLTHGTKAYAWTVERAFVPAPIVRRFATAYIETGKGLLIGIGLTALLQAFVATVGYVLLGVPRAPALCFLTFLAALIPTFGTALVWVPVAFALLMSGRPGAAAVMTVFGLVAGIVDNVARPWLARWGRLKLPSLVVFVSMLGGLAAFGAWGLILGPLFVRLMVEALELVREYRVTSSASLERSAPTS